MKTDALEFPVFVFGKDFYRVEDNVEELTTCTRYAFKHKYYDGMIILDASGKRYRLVRVCKLHYHKFFSLRTLTYGPLLLLDFELEFQEKVPLENAKKEILERIAPAASELGIETSYIVAIVTQSVSFQDLFDKLKILIN